MFNPASKRSHAAAQLLELHHTAREPVAPPRIERSRNIFSIAIRSLHERPAGNVPSLDVLRSAAILLVLSLHVGEFFPARVQNLPFVFYGWSGVDLFFVLSGFLIGGQLWKELYRRGTIDVGRFLLRRGLRIWPLYFAFILAVGGYTLEVGKPVRDLVFDILCISNYFHHLVAGGWSLSTEEQFYVLVPLVFYFGCRLLRSPNIVVLPVLWLLVLPVLRWLTMLHAYPSQDPHITYYPFHTHSDGLAVGLVIAWLAVTKPALLNTKTWVNVSTCFAGIAVALSLRQISQPLFRFSCLAVLYGSIVFFLLRTRTLPRFVSWRGFYVVSRLSYGMYLNQFDVIHFIPKLQLVVGTGIFGFAICWILSLIASMLVAFVTFAVIEEPFLRLRDRWLVRTKYQAPVAGAFPAAAG